ncbi:MAG: formyltetrahydrofolate deformylase [Steroidobacteraceae bacterium]
MSTDQTLTLTVACPDRVGIVARVATFIAEHHGSIIEANHHSDAGTQRFFMRNVIQASSLPFDAAGFRQRFAPIAAGFDMHWQVSESAQPKRVLILVSKHDHCLVDLLYRWRSGDLPCEVVGVVSNHPDLRDYTEWHGVPFYHLPVNKENKAESYERLCALYEGLRGDVMVLARYMQILSSEVCARYPGRIINIHHGFLPSFIGAAPYQQAFDRGVKLIGATCHYVTEELDQGPIIEQDVIRIDHSDSVSDLVHYGKDIERQVLSRGLRYHLEDRVLRNGRRTVVFR